MGKFINRVGEFHGSLQIIEELGRDRVICKCSIDQSISEYYKSKVVSGKVQCLYCTLRKKQAQRVK